MMIMFHLGFMLFILFVGIKISDCRPEGRALNVLQSVGEGFIALLFVFNIMSVMTYDVKVEDVGRQINGQKVNVHLTQEACRFYSFPWSCSFIEIGDETVTDWSSIRSAKVLVNDAIRSVEQREQQKKSLLRSFVPSEKGEVK